MGERGSRRKKNDFQISGLDNWVLNLVLIPGPVSFTQDNEYRRKKFEKAVGHPRRDTQ